MSDRYQVSLAFEGELSSDLRADLFAWLKDRCQRVDGSSPMRNVEVSLDGPGLSCGIQYDATGRTATSLPQLTCTVGDHHFFPREGESDREAVDRIDTLYTFVREIYEACVERDATPLYVYGVSPVEFDRATDPDHPNGITGERLLSAELPGIWWCQVLPPRMARRYCPDDLQSIPAFRVERVSDGGVLLVVYHAVTVEGAREHSPKTVAEELGVDWTF